MTEHDLNEIIDKDISQRWPQWNPTELQVSDLRYMLKRFDLITVRAAIRQYAMETAWNSPKIKDLKAICMRLRPKSKQQQMGPEPTVYIKCVEKDADGNGPVGRFSAIEFRIRPLNIIHDPATILNVAHREIETCKRLYGGLWQVLQNTSYDIVRGYAARQERTA